MSKKELVQVREKTYRDHTPPAKRCETCGHRSTHYVLGSEQTQCTLTDGFFIEVHENGCCDAYKKGTREQFYREEKQARRVAKLKQKIAEART